MTDFNYKELLQIIEMIDASADFAEFHLKVGDIELDLRKVPPEGAPAPMPASAVRPVQPAPAPFQVPPVASLGDTAPAPRAHAKQATDIQIPPGSVVVKSPMVGIFYRAPEPDASPFIEVGQRVQSDTVVCIIEVMKLINSMPAGHAGVVTHILVENAQMVEVDQPLMVIDLKA